VELDPLSPLYTSVLGYSDYYQREYDQTIEQSNKTLEIDPRHGGAFASLGAPHWQMGNYKEAIEQDIKAMQRAGYDQRAKELTEDFAKTGYKGILRKHAKSEAAGYDLWCRR
jgi:tetratricopeptide (TPR) repeat protein